ncbi:segregation and condensation protein B [Kribbella sp. VKM Ac-2571]|uniref:SMC-Scp complex subunit ScpB n=1 Tax=Kribbella sp. VKM Ac-2571 TaxID=2512222 RepID=UPI0010CFC7C1|nr:segregation and condensation protein B [Kribbella sp. VKM Ac-2571]
MTNSHDPSTPEATTPPEDKTSTEPQPSTTPDATITSDATTTPDATTTLDATTTPDAAPTSGAATTSDVVEQVDVADEGVGEGFAPESAGNSPQPVEEDEEHLPPGQTAVPVGDEVVVDDDTMRRALEAILMVTDEPLPVLTLARAVGRPTGDVAAALEELAAEYTEQGRGFDLREVGGGWRYYTRAEAALYVERFVLDGQQARLTQAALETLAVVAYKQPVSRARVSAIRGVNVDGVMRTLVARGLVEEAGSDTESQATLYRTTTYFLERMGMQSLDDLPELAPYLPDMDDIEDELAAQSLPPAPTPDAPSSADEAGQAEGSDDATAPAPDTASTPTDQAAAEEYTEDAEAGEAERLDDAAAPAPEGTFAEEYTAELGEGLDGAAAPTPDSTFAEDADAEGAEGAEVGAVEMSEEAAAAATDSSSAEEAGSEGVDSVDVDVDSEAAADVDVESGDVDAEDDAGAGDAGVALGVEAGVRDGG